MGACWASHAFVTLFLWCHLFVATTMYNLVRCAHQVRKQAPLPHLKTQILIEVIGPCVILICIVCGLCWRSRRWYLGGALPMIPVAILWWMVIGVGDEGTRAAWLSLALYALLTVGFILRN